MKTRPPREILPVLVHGPRGQGTAGAQTGPGGVPQGGGEEEGGEGGDSKRLVDAAARPEVLGQVNILFNECPYEGVLLRAFADPFEQCEVGIMLWRLTMVLRNRCCLQRFKVDRLPVKTTAAETTENVSGSMIKLVGVLLAKLPTRQII
ncbi:hypothetical protein LX32DRAFT_222815 [Colletotrichum zoysiae]|uniref:Uncharacterized protein n=1 Tax=Colletotrichum zoysiae TaxID=1216348 RepID=A0AAD9LXM4_9PEZI|nr:hypothetical protein LX32DRAFT_222815 [Colletotrichum zoysiae]